MPVENRTSHTEVPVYGFAVIRRRRLHRALSAVMTPTDGTPSTVALISAPVGSGKTMLLADWFAETSATQDPPVAAWHTARESDNGRGALAASLLTALRGSGDPAVTDALRSIPPTDSADLAVAVANRLGALGKPVWIVLDDVHTLHDPDALEMLGTFLRVAPPTVRTVLSGRFEPPLTLHRMRMDGRVRDFPPHELAFTEEEAAQLFSDHGVQLDPDDLTTVVARTQGWAAGLRLAAITLARHPAPARMIADFSGADRVVADYLVGEVLAQLGRGEREFVVETSIPDAYSIELAEALTGNPDAGRIVDLLERENFLIERVPGRAGWYRYHPLLREYLRAEVGRLGHRAVTGLEQLAAGWFAESGSYPDALEHSLHTGDTDSVVSLLAEGGLRSVLSGHGDRLLGVLNLASRRVQSAPAARRVRAAAELERGHCAAAASVLGPADPTITGVEALFEDTLRLQLALLGTGGITPALTALAADPVGQTGTPELDAFARLHQGTAEFHLDRLESAQAHLEAARATAGAAGLFSVELQAMAVLTVVAAVRCQLTEADRRAAEGVEFARRHDLTDRHHTLIAEAIRHWVRYLRIDPCPDPTDLTPLAACPDPGIATAAMCVQSMLGAFPAGAGGTAPLEEHLSAVHTQPIPLAVTALIVPAVVRRLLADGDDGRAVRVIDCTAPILEDSGEVALARAMVEVRRGRNDAADRPLRAVVDGTVACITPFARIHALLLTATIADSRGDDTRARGALTDALALAEPEGVARPFVDEGMRIRPLLDRHVGRFGVHDEFAEHVRKAVPVTAPDPVCQLTARERELLAELPSWRTAEQIAADLFVSVNTVKTHLRGIYRKLGVGTRQEAIATARSLGLL